MKKLLLSYLMLISFSLFAQEMNEDYLDSLPEEMREEVLETIELKEETEKPFYRAASTKVDKDEEKEKQPKRWAISEFDVFGKKFFDTMQSSFMPINEPNLDSSYIMDFGDQIEVQLIGQKDSVETYYIKRDGSINIPDVGKIILSGLSLDDASSLIKAKVLNSFIGTEAFISLANI